MYTTSAKLKSAKVSYSHMVIPYRTAKFKSANILALAILGSTAKFNSRQYFRLYGITVTHNSRNPISLLRNSMCHAHVMLHKEKC